MPKYNFPFFYTLGNKYVIPLFLYKFKSLPVSIRTYHLCNINSFTYRMNIDSRNISHR